MIHDVIRTANPFPYSAKFMFVRVRNNKNQQIRKINRKWKINRIRTWCCRISKIFTCISVGRNDNFLAKARKLSTSLDIFDIRQHYVRILYSAIYFLETFMFIRTTHKEPQTSTNYTHMVSVRSRPFKNVRFHHDDIDDKTEDEWNHHMFVYCDATTL